MIGYLCGTVRAHDTVVTSGGVGYRVHTPGALTVGDDVELWVETIVRETAITLYGFDTTDARDLFCAICAVNGVGPAVALSVLGRLDVGDAVAALVARDIAALRGPGVGPKTAEKLCAGIKLPEHLTDLAGDAPVVVPATGEVLEPAVADIVGALDDLGFGRGDNVIAAARAAVDSHDDLSTQIPAALAALRAA